MPIGAVRAWRYSSLLQRASPSHMTPSPQSSVRAGCFSACWHCTELLSLKLSTAHHIQEQHNKQVTQGDFTLLCQFCSCKTSLTNFRCCWKNPSGTKLLHIYASRLRTSVHGHFDLWFQICTFRSVTVDLLRRIFSQAKKAQVYPAGWRWSYCLAAILVLYWRQMEENKAIFS